MYCRTRWPLVNSVHRSGEPIASLRYCSTFDFRWSLLVSLYSSIAVCLVEGLPWFDLVRFILGAWYVCDPTDNSTEGAILSGDTTSVWRRPYLFEGLTGILLLVRFFLPLDTVLLYYGKYILKSRVGYEVLRLPFNLGKCLLWSLGSRVILPFRY